jgi:hypothetical protein
MTTPERDPLGAMFDQYAERTAAETTRATGGQLRRRMHRHRTARVAAVGVAAAVLAVPAGWALQNAGASGEPIGAADQGVAADASENLPPCDGWDVLTLNLTPIELPEGTTLNEYMASEEGRALMLALPDGADVVELDEVTANVVMLLTPGGDELEDYVDPEDYGVTVAPDEAISDTDRAGMEAFVAEALVECVDPTASAPSESSGTPSEDPSEGGEEPSEGGEDPSEGSEEPSEGGDEPSEGGDEPSNDGSTPTAEEPTTGFDEPSEYSTP